MNKAAKVALVVLICLACLCTLYLGFVFTVGSGFIFAGDIDLQGEQLRTANTKAAIGSIFGVIVIFISLFVMVFSGKISNFILKLFSPKTDD